ncbi:MAG: hypothetical protein LUG52_00560 [Clostridia bacterium]|nr:hypothetical protein [Clostridia bacterium]
MKKWQKIALVIIVVLGVAVCVKSCVDKTDADLKIAYIGYDFIVSDTFDENADEISSLVGDINGDGEAIVDIIEISFNDSLSESDLENSRQKKTSALGSGTSRLYLIDKEFIDAEASSDYEIFADISSLGEGITNSAGQTVAISLEDNEKVKLLGVRDTTDLCLALRVVSEMDTVLYKNIEEQNAAAKRVAEWILSEN